MENNNIIGMTPAEFQEAIETANGVPPVVKEWSKDVISLLVASVAELSQRVDLLEEGLTDLVYQQRELERRVMANSIDGINLHG